MHGSSGNPVFAVLLTASALYAATWQKESAPFSFPDAAQARKAAPVAMSAVTFRQSARKVVFTVPAGKVKAAGTVSVFRADGVLLQTIKLDPRCTVAEWNLRDGKTSTGIYLVRVTRGDYSREMKIAVFGQGVPQ